MRDAWNKTAKAHLLDAQQINSTTTSKYVDLQGFEAALLVVNMGAGANLDSGDYFTFTVEESDDTTDANFSAVAAADLIGDIDASLVVDADDEDAITKTVSYIGSKRYIRVVITETSDTGNATLYVGVSAILSRARHDDPASGITPTTGTAS